MYGYCPICGQIYGSDGTFKDGKLHQYPLCLHMTEKQKEFMEKKTKVSCIFPGGRGSRNTACPLYMKPLIKSNFPSSILNLREKQK